MIKRMIGRTTIILTAMLLLSVPAAIVFAGGQEEGAGSQAGKTEIVWYDRVHSTENVWAEEVIGIFESQQPGVEVELVTAPWDQFDEKLLMLYSSGDSPDMWSNHAQNGFMDMVRRGMIRSVYDLIKKDNYDLSIFPEVSVKMANLDGKQFGIPYLQGGSYIVYNADLFDAAGVGYPPSSWEDQGWTWDRFFEISKKLVKDTDGDSRIDQWATHQINPWPTNTITYYTGGDFFDRQTYEQTGVPKKIHLNTKKNAAGFQLYIDGMYKHKICPPYEQLPDITAQGDPFASGKFAMDSNGLWMFNHTADETRTFRIGFAAAPKAANEQRINSFWSDPWMISSKSKHADETWELIKFLVDEKAEKTYVDHVGWPPANNKVVDYWMKDVVDNSILDKKQVKELLEGSAKYGRGLADSRVKYYLELNQIWTAELQRAWLVEITIEQALAKAEELIVKAYADKGITVKVAPEGDPDFIANPLDVR